MPLALIKILVCFALVLILSRFRWPLSLALFAGALGLGFWAGLAPAVVTGAIGESVWQWQTLYLILIINLILLISRLMEKAGQLKRIVESFSRLVRDRRVVSALIPILIGVLPMPGGALFSAPLVGSATDKHRLAPEHKTIINYWFRHVWEYWWPLYPGFILVVALLNVSLWKVMLIQFPLAVFCLIAGGIFLLLPFPRLAPEAGGERTRHARTFLKESLPILLVVVVIFLVSLLFRLLRGVGVEVALPSGVPVLLGLLVCLVWVIGFNHLSGGEIAAGLRDRKFISFTFLIIAVMIFQGVLARSGIVLAVKDELTAFRIPVQVIVVFLPFISGLITGIAIGFVGLSFPVILPLISGHPPLSYLAYAALAYSFGYMGMMLSPVHLCFLVSKDYFGAGFSSSYRLLIKPVLLVMLLTVLYFLVLTRIS